LIDQFIDRLNSNYTNHFHTLNLLSPFVLPLQLITEAK